MLVCSFRWNELLTRLHHLSKVNFSIPIVISSISVNPDEIIPIFPTIFKRTVYVHFFAYYLNELLLSRRANEIKTFKNNTRTNAVKCWFYWTDLNKIQHINWILVNIFAEELFILMSVQIKLPSGFEW